MTRRMLAVVTGAGSGIGAACAEMLAARNYDVVLADIREAPIRELAAKLDARWRVLDVADEAATERLADELFSERPVDALVASAGVLQPVARPHELAMSDWDHVVSVDLRGLYLTCRAFGTRMAYAGSGSIVTISSGSGLVSSPLHAYGPAKAAVISLTQNLAAEWGRSGVRVNGVAPGLTLTEAVLERIEAGSRDLNAFSRDQVLGRGLEPSEIAAPTCFLLSNEASGITGVTLPVDGGLLACGVWNSYGGLRAKYQATDSVPQFR